jgi:hypothetical protein
MAVVEKFLILVHTESCSLPGAMLSIGIAGEWGDYYGKKRVFAF